MPEWMWLLIGWCLASVCFTLGLARWLKWLGR